VLSWLCDWALQESDRVVAHLGERAEGKSLTPIGEDSAGFSYWHFGAHSSRIYRDGARVPEGAPEDQWTIVADSAVEMGNLAEGLRKSDSARERALARTISESILPAFLVESKKKVLPPFQNKSTDMRTQTASTGQGASRGQRGGRLGRHYL